MRQQKSPILKSLGTLIWTINFSLFSIGVLDGDSKGAFISRLRLVPLPGFPDFVANILVPAPLIAFGSVAVLTL